jgi:Ca2+-binding EF-hand superfamily protein
MSSEEAEEEVQKIFETVDTDASESIDFSEFMAAVINKREFLT